MNTEQIIESILFFKNEPVSVPELSKIIGIDKEEIKSALRNLQEFYKDRGITLVSDGDSYVFGTNPKSSGIIEKLQKEELSRDLGRAGLETLAIILYRGPISRREIDFIRGVNSGFILRNLLIRGLIERTESTSGERSYTYKPTLELIRHLGVGRKEDLPEYGSAFAKIDNFMKNPPSDANE